MKLQIALIEWKYPQHKTPITPTLWDLTQETTLMELYLTFANGIIIELKAEGETEEALDVLRGLAQGAGACILTTPSPAKQKTLWLYQANYECYQQGTTDPAYIYINPIPQPQKFT